MVCIVMYYISIGRIDNETLLEGKGQADENCGQPFVAWCKGQAGVSDQLEIILL